MPPTHRSSSPVLRAAGFYIEPLVGWRRIMLFMSCTGLFALIVRRSLTLPNTPIKHRVPYSKLCGQPAFRVSAAFILAVLKLGTYWTCYTWLPTFLHKHMHQSIAKSFRWIATSQVGQFTGMLLFGRFSDFIGRRPAFVVYGLLTAAAIACLAFQWPFLSAHPSLFWTVMFTLGLGSGCTGGLGALMAELFPTEIRSLAMGKPPFCRRRAHTCALPFCFLKRCPTRSSPSTPMLVFTRSPPSAYLVMQARRTTARGACSWSRPTWWPLHSSGRASRVLSVCQ
jgi:MFS family permease